MMNPLVSVIVPNYNYATYLPLRIESILNQSFTDFELILLDDASSDNSVEIFKHYQDIDGRISHFVVNECNSGTPFKQWQKGIELSRGKYIWIAESDDYADVSFLERTVSLLEEYPTAVYCFTGSYLVDDVGNILSREMDHWTEKQQNNPMKYKLFSGIDYVAGNLYWTNYVYNASGVLFRRYSYLKMVDKAWISKHYCGDWYFWSFMALQGNVIEVYERLNYFRQHLRSVTVGSKQNDEVNAECMKECMELTCAIEDRLSLSLYKRLLCYGNYYKMIKRQNFEMEIKQDLLKKLRTRFHHVKMAYYLERINKCLSSVFPLLNRIKSERCH